MKYLREYLTFKNEDKDALLASKYLESIIPVPYDEGFINCSYFVPIIVEEGTISFNITFEMSMEEINLRKMNPFLKDLEKFDVKLINQKAVGTEWHMKIEVPVSLVKEWAEKQAIKTDSEKFGI